MFTINGLGPGFPLYIEMVKAIVIQEYDFNLEKDHILFISSGWWKNPLSRL